MVYAILIFGILFIISLVYDVLCEKNRFLSASCLCIFTYIFSGLLMDYQSNEKPSAIDVYRGKTTLEITYKDGVPVDSTVVFKNK